LTKDMQELFTLPEWASTMDLVEASEKTPGMELEFD